MHHWAGRVLAVVGVLAAMSATSAVANPVDDEVGVGMGAFFQVNGERKVGDNDATFTYPGARLTARGQEWGEGYADLGWESVDLKHYDVNGALAYGVGGTLWCWKWRNATAPVSLGLAGDCHMSEHAMAPSGGGGQTDVRHTSMDVQAVVKARFGSLSPYVRVGCMESRLDPDQDGFFGNADTRSTVPAIQGGFEYEFDDQVDRFTIDVEASYFSAPGAAIRFAYWF